MRSRRANANASGDAHDPTAVSREERRDGLSAKVIRWALKLASSQCNVLLCETDTAPPTSGVGECGPILETLKGQTASGYKLQIYDLVLHT